MTIYFLDMGIAQYGDCIVIEQGERRILVDFGKPSDQSSLRLQLKKILRQDPPFKFDLLVLTHCHDDHIGSLPELIGNEQISAAKYLLADPVFRWGSEGERDGANDFISEALFEEDHSSLTDSELEAFILDTTQIEMRYRKMIKTLEDRGSDIILYQGDNDNRFNALQEEFKDFGLEILGPTKKHLDITQNSISGARDSIDSFLENSSNEDSVKDIVDLYRRIFKDGTIDDEVFLDAAKNKGGINDQSIVVKVGEEGFTALLAGDMQFAEPDVKNIDAEMKKLLNKVFQKGPYNLVKTCHHTSHNGLNAPMLDRLIGDGTVFFVHSGGLRDDDHPNSEVLDLLKDRKNRIKFARTDRNGLITAGKNSSGNLGLKVVKGSLNNFSPNIITDETSQTEEIQAGESLTNSVNTGTKSELKTALVQQITQAKSGPVGNIELNAKIPTDLVKVTITVEIDSEKKKPLSQNKPVNNSPTESNRFDNLLFVTNSEKLKGNIGASETEEIMAFLFGKTNARVLDIVSDGDVVATAKEVSNEILPDTKGIVIIGGYDVIPSAQLNVISDEMRKKIEIESEQNGEEAESDNFIVWSDDIYGDKDNDFLPELPVSRIPDGKSSVLILNALNAPSFTIKDKFGIRNLNRPFAIDVFERIPFNGKKQFEVSETCSPKQVRPEEPTGGVYFMLHGFHGDATRFSGESEDASSFEAFDIYNVPKSCPGTVVFTGCCYGALIALPKADRKEPDITIRSRTAEQSIALAFLMGSANAFVGCTGAHYSPKRQEDNFFGKPMHNAFWANIIKGEPPALALLNAKKEYAIGMPHNLKKTLSQAIEIKILHQFTCLGLGW